MQLTFMRKIRLLAYSGDRLKQANVYLQNWLAIEEALLCGGGGGGGGGGGLVIPYSCNS